MLGLDALVEEGGGLDVLGAASGMVVENTRFHPHDNQRRSVLLSEVNVYFDHHVGAVAQLGEHLVCNQGVAGSIPVRSI